MARLFSSRRRPVQTGANAAWTHRSGAGAALPAVEDEADDLELAETRLISDPSYQRSTAAVPANDEATETRRLSWPARDAAPGARRSAPDDGAFEARPSSQPSALPPSALAPSALAPSALVPATDDMTRLAPRVGRRAAPPRDDATVLLPPGKPLPPVDGATVLIQARKRPGA